MDYYFCLFAFKCGVRAIAVSLKIRLDWIGLEMIMKLIPMSSFYVSVLERARGYLATVISIQIKEFLTIYSSQSS